MIDSTTSKQHTLSIRLSTDGFSFSIYNPLSDEPLSVEEKETDSSISLTANLKKLFRETELFNQPYKRVHILIADKHFTLVPLEYFTEEEAETLYHYNHTARENETICYNLVRKNNVAVIYSIDKSVVKFISEQYPEARFYSQATPLIEYFAIKSRLGNSKKMYVSIRKESIELFCFERGHLLLGNSFDCSQTADRIYYILYTWKQLKFDQERDELHLTGKLADKETLIKELKRFLLQVYVTNPESNIDIQALLTCE